MSVFFWNHLHQLPKVGLNPVYAQTTAQSVLTFPVSVDSSIRMLNFFFSSGFLTDSQNSSRQHALIWQLPNDMFCSAFESLNMSLITSSRWSVALGAMLCSATVISATDSVLQHRQNALLSDPATGLSHPKWLYHSITLISLLHHSLSLSHPRFSHFSLLRSSSFFFFLTRLGSV